MVNMFSKSLLEIRVNKNKKNSIKTQTRETHLNDIDSSSANIINQLFLSLDKIKFINMLT